MKATTDQIRERFDTDVERFSTLETGQSSTIDAPLVLELITATAAAVNPNATAVLDVGCGAGNYTLKLLGRLPGLNVTLIDLSEPMLARAEERITAAGARSVERLQGDVRDLELGEERFDVILAAAVLHHLRTDEEWRSVFTALYRSLKPGGSLWISDLVSHGSPAVQAEMWRLYGEYLVSLKGEDYRDHVYAYVEFEDTPRTVLFQLDLLSEVGFREVDVLHKHGCFAAFGGVK
jgi:tRNA (cmo5U34)-methyltransferase